MPIGTNFVAKLGAVVTYVKARVDIKLDYDSKNFNLTDGASLSELVSLVVTYIRSLVETVSLSDITALGVGKNLTETATATDVATIGMTINVAESISVSDTLSSYHDGMLNTSTLNGRALGAGKTLVTSDNVTIT